MLYSVGYCQFEPQLLRPDENRMLIADLLAGVEADLVVLPELATSGYLFTSHDDLLRVAEPALEGPTAAMLRQIAHDHDMSIVIGFPELTEHGVYNSCMLVNPGGDVHVYRKTHLFYYEKTWFLPGDTGFFVVPAKGGVPVGLMICFDWYFPESARTLALRGAHIICHPANLVLPWCQQAMTVRSLENRVFAITANRYGTDSAKGHNVTFTGRSQVTTPTGEVLGRAPEQQAELKIFSIDPDLARDKWVTERNNIFDDRRIEMYESINTQGEK